MGPGFVTLISVGVLALLVVLILVAVHNRLVTLKNRYENAFSQIDVQLQRRHDLVPNLVETARGYLAHERATLEAVTAARAAAVNDLDHAKRTPGDAGAIAALSGAESALSGALGRLFAVVESYPDLKADASLRTVQEELRTTENRVAFARQAFNDAVTAYNTYRQSFPPVMLAGAYGHGADATLLEFDRAAIAAPPEVAFV